MPQTCKSSSAGLSAPIHAGGACSSCNSSGAGRAGARAGLMTGARVMGSRGLDRRRRESDATAAAQRWNAHSSERVLTRVKVSLAPQREQV